MVESREGTLVGMIGRHLTDHRPAVPMALKGTDPETELVAVAVRTMALIGVAPETELAAAGMGLLLGHLRQIHQPGSCRQTNQRCASLAPRLCRSAR
jgi:hypothetical protein